MLLSGSRPAMTTFRGRQLNAAGEIEVTWIAVHGAQSYNVFVEIPTSSYEDNRGALQQIAGRGFQQGRREQFFLASFVFEMRKRLERSMSTFKVQMMFGQTSPRHSQSMCLSLKHEEPRNSHLHVSLNTFSPSMVFGAAAAYDVPYTGAKKGRQD
ncbi:hypothetical protein AC579_7975 [Pseudocercospora musae]|uniref:Uncharacterized protein n=1 Tax=Pseudocercospora musae TaxID=113226 RepID=A0A139IBY5_9PEZI|nr:hypothetical protein AC579_7975 [Pseudocercospora musae]